MLKENTEKNALKSMVAQIHNTMTGDDPDKAVMPTSMKIIPMKSIEPGNPFLGDMFHIGDDIGLNVTVMFSQHTTEVQPYIIIVNTTTGERIKIELS